MDLSSCLAEKRTNEAGNSGLARSQDYKRRITLYVLLSGLSRRRMSGELVVAQDGRRQS